ncbi:MAG: NADH-quinone oxidoreductase subunit A [Candidatus Omnitrophica bacterium]|nr:NADH-quinone oxidoreductase subunit A [Candidatus Omnitrophota bacterium]
MELLQNYSYVLVFLVIGFGFVLVNTLLPFLITKPSRNPGTAATYESGETPIGSAWVQFDILYYLYALVFIAFDVEAVFLFPVLVAYKSFSPVAAFVEVTLFVFILGLGIAYAWRKGIFSWK